MISQKHSRAGLLAGACAVALFAGPALAAPQAAPVEAVAADSEAPAPETEGLQEIVVTATKRETNLQKTPISISVLSSEALKQRRVQSLIDLADGAVPSLRVATFESRQSALTIGIRGIVPGDANQPAREQGVGVYIDGVYLGRQHGLNASLFDVARIEVLKGPQGTLFGRNTEGGALSIVTKLPTGEFGGGVTAGFGNYGSYNGALHLDLPSFANIAVKLDGVIQHQGPTTANPLPGQAGFNQYHRYGGRVSALWKPIDGLSVNLSFDKSRDENTPFYSDLVTVSPAGLVNLPAIVNYGFVRSKVADIGVPQQPSIDKTQGFTSTIKYKVSPGLELRSITAWRTVSDEQWDNSGGAHRTPVARANTAFSRYSLSNLGQRQFSQELQAVGSIAAIDYVLGLYYFNESANDAARTPNTNRWNADLSGFTIIDPSTYLLAPIARASRAYAKSYAVYGQAT
ncbi:TonB-dependent receptor [Novosphingobium sp. Chol11]|uniref:TonB-dependent receptor n=1 Tax=Novosphingobium sp. Chol11 TaxID=1385763 RepID=UPI00345BA684